MEEKTTKKTTKKKNYKKNEDSEIIVPVEEVVNNDTHIVNTPEVEVLVGEIVEPLDSKTIPLNTPILAVSIEEEEEKIITGVVARCSSLRVRSAPNLKSRELGLLKKGTKVIITENKSTDNFYSVSYKGGEGFCLKTFIDII